MGRFVWGAASASYQIEGGADSRGASIWDEFSHRPGTVWRGHTGDTACDSYHRFDEDLDLLAKLGISNYRFSVSWPRIVPEGDGSVNPTGLSYYDRVVDGCLERGIIPWLTLFHWDLPQALQDDSGGWQSRKTAEAFARLAGLVAEHFRGRVKHYFILNEPQCFIGLGYGTGEHAPGLRLEDNALFDCWRNMLLAWGLAVRAVRDQAPDALVGIASTGRVCCPCTDGDLAAAERAMFAVDERWHFTHQMLLDPICLGRFPDCTGSPIATAVTQVSREEMETIAQRPDFLGLNIYHGEQVRTSPDGQPEVVPEYEGFPRTAQKWPIVPQSLYWGPTFLWRRYNLPLYISENGCSCNDKISLDGGVHDPDRIDFLHRYLLALRKAVREGVPVQGYFHWSLTDNFEWACGYDDRFGLIYIDYPTGNRIPKDSALWYSRLIRDGGLEAL